MQASAAASGRLPGHTDLAIDDVAEELGAGHEGWRDVVAQRQREREDRAGHDGRQGQRPDHLAEREPGPRRRGRPEASRSELGMRSSPATMGRIMYGSQRYVKTSQHRDVAVARPLEAERLEQPS